MTVSPIDSAPVFDDAAERAVLGSILINNAALPRVTPPLTPRDFYHNHHKIIFEAMMVMDADGTAIDVLTLKGELAQRGPLEQAGGHSYISSLVDGIPDIANVERYADIVRAKSSARTLKRGLDVASLAAAEGRTVEEITGTLQPIIDSICKRESESKQGSDSSSLTSLANFLSEPTPEVDWLCDGLLLRGGAGLLVAKPKAGKSTLSRDVTFSVATGTPFLGRKTRKGRVLFIAMEEHRDRLREQFGRMGFAGDEEVLVHTGPAPADGVAWLRGLVNQHRPDLVVIDPVLKLVRVGDANAYAETSGALEPLGAIARDSGACLLLIHHANKFGDGNGGESVLGSTAIFGLADVVLLLKRRDDQTRTVQTIQRYGQDMPETVLSMDPDTGLLGIGGDYQEIKLESVIARIADALRAGRPMTEGDIRDAVGGDRTVLAHAIRHAVKTGALRRSGNGKKGSPYMYSTGGEMLAS
jgi:hypothetical protein